MSSQTPGPAAKRRRVEVANAALRKPFRSPLLNRTMPASGATSATPDSPINNMPTKSSPPIYRPPGTAGRGARNGFSTPVMTRAYAASPLRRNVGRKSLDVRAGPAKDESANPAREKILKLQRKMVAAQRQADDDLALAQQAAKIQRESNAKRPGAEVDAELSELVEKWKGASRLAADELFELIKCRVDSMGGARAWRETRRRQERGFNGFDDERDSKGKSLHSPEDVDGDVRDVEEEERGDEGEEEGFTMLMMLKSLNIEPELLGYDTVEGKWAE
ncbi:hypothetical protein OQA88_4181 [Cercophora sp. LCS_1]